MILRRGRAAPVAALAALALGVLLLAHPQAAARGFADGLALCTGSVLPALFPFFVVCELLCASAAAEILSRPLAPLARCCGAREPAAPLALFLSLLGGYAVCAATLGRMQADGRLCEESAERLLLVGLCAGPGFAVGCCGGLLLGSVRTGVLLYGLQLGAGLLAAACLMPFLKASAADREKSAGDTAHRAVSLPQAIDSAVGSALRVCGCTIFFCIAAECLRPFLPRTALAWPLLGAALEVSTGCAAFAQLGGAAALYGVCLCVSLPGLSVFCQVRTLYGPRTPTAALAVCRLLHAVWLQLLMRLCARFLPDALPAWSSLSGRVILASRLPPDAALISFAFLCCALYKMGQRFYNRGDSTR